MGELFIFSIVAFFTGILGVILGGPFRLLVVENEVIESVIWRAIFGFIFFPPVVGVALMLLYFLFSPNPELEPIHWGAIVGLIAGMTYSFVISGKSKNHHDKNT